jgi:hypothetical protein
MREFDQQVLQSGVTELVHGSGLAQHLPVKAVWRNGRNRTRLPQSPRISSAAISCRAGIPILLPTRAITSATPRATATPAARLMASVANGWWSEASDPSAGSPDGDRCGRCRFTPSMSRLGRMRSIHFGSQHALPLGAGRVSPSGGGRSLGLRSVRGLLAQRIDVHQEGCSGRAGDPSRLEVRRCYRWV